MNKPQFITVEADYAGQRIDNFLTTRLKGLPKSRLYRLLRKGEVRVNKKRIKPEYRIQGGDIVRIPPIRLASDDKTAIMPATGTIELLEQRILWEDKGLLILDKPAGMAVHGGSGVSLGVIEVMRKARPKQAFLELAHRLDRDTSGCLILAKKPSILKQLHELLREGQVEKVYIARVKGHWPSQVKRVDVPLQKFQLRSGERMVEVHSEGKSALTEFRVLRYDEETTLLEVTLHTGRTHQIRVHAAHVGCPIVGDTKYGDKDFNQKMRRQGYKRLFLHALRVAFTLPDTDQVITVEAESPKLIGSLKNTPNFGGKDPVELQKKLRDEWEN